LVWGNALLVLDLGFDIVDGVARLYLKGNSLARQGLYKAVQSNVSTVQKEISSYLKSLHLSNSHYLHLHLRGDLSAKLIDVVKVLRRNLFRSGRRCRASPNYRFGCNKLVLRHVPVFTCNSKIDIVEVSLNSLR
jgi:hypothetical protein